MLRRRTVEKSGQKESRAHPNTMESTTRAGADYVRFSGCLWINGMGDTEMNDIEQAHDNALRDFNARLHNIEVVLNNLNGAMAAQAQAKSDRSWVFDGLRNDLSGAQKDLQALWSNWNMMTQRVNGLQNRIIDLELASHTHGKSKVFIDDRANAFGMEYPPNLPPFPFELDPRDAFLPGNKEQVSSVTPKRKKSKKGGAK